MMVLSFTELIFFTIVEKGSRSSPIRPIPSIESITISFSPSKESTLLRSLCIFISCFFNFAKFSFALSVFTLSPVRNTDTLHAFARYLAATKPSPPLFPVPQKTIIFLFSEFS